MGWSLLGRETSLHWRLIDFNYLGGLTIRSFPNSETYDINWAVQLGFALSVEPAIKILGISVSHLGLGYRFSENARAVVVETKFPF